MFLSAYAQVIDAGAGRPPGSMAFWVGAFDVAAAPLADGLAAFVGGQAMPVTVVAAFQPIRDGSSRNWHARIVVAGPALPPAASNGLIQQRRVRIELAGERVEVDSLPLPAAVPEESDGAFRILLSSCYFEPNDPHRRLSARVAREARPDLVVLAGDQVYLDLPLTENLPEKDDALRRLLGEKYRRNFALGPADQQASGLDALLKAGPLVCIADDHEYWNNYPYAQAQLPDTWKAGRRERWERAARELYEDYQCTPGQRATRAHRLDVAPLKLLFLDLRSGRSEVVDKRETGPDPERLFDATALAALHRWRDDLLAERQAGGAPVGVLSSGQILFLGRPSDFKKSVVDAEMANYRQFDEIHAALQALATAGVPVVYVSGDVHWGRIAKAAHRARPVVWPDALIEVVASPSTLIDNPGDFAKKGWSTARGWFGDRDPWPTHAATEEPPASFGPGDAPNRYAPLRVFPREAKACLGNHFAMLAFTRRSGRISLQVTYHPIHKDAKYQTPLHAEPIDIGPPRSAAP